MLIALSLSLELFRDIAYSYEQMQTNGQVRFHFQMKITHKSFDMFALSKMHKM